MGIFEHYQQRYEKAREEEYSIQEFLDMCKQDKACYASAAERLLVAIGEPEMIDTSVVNQHRKMTRDQRPKLTRASWLISSSV
ncbi:hypothetical protein [Aeromonas salmonicida]|uniref:hypothetical protein n=1 Tax=Aeromonas salmonicida TaxID=645 RepID=UPI000B0DC426|nr:hypothetical protein [Aeromonas salmonicida]